jgi:regulator of replication initiation timing
MGFPVRRTKPGEKGSVLAVPREIDSWVKSQQFTDGRLDLATLRRSLRDLRIENRELRLENRELLRRLASQASASATMRSNSFGQTNAPTPAPTCRQEVWTE